MSHTHTRQVQTSRTFNIYYITVNFAFHLSQAERLPRSFNVGISRYAYAHKWNSIRIYLIYVVSLASKNQE